MKSRIADKDVLQLLTSLKNADNNYPRDLIESRRDLFTKKAAAMAVLMKAGTNGAGASQAASTASTTSGSAGISSISMGTLLETLLVAALVVEAVVATYVYREKIAEFFTSTFGPKVEQVSNPANNPSDIVTSNETVTVQALDETPAVTKTPTATVTPPILSITPPAQAEDNNNGSGDAGNTQVESTPDQKDNNGKHLGQTKQPSKDPKKNDDSDSKDKNKNK